MEQLPARPACYATPQQPLHRSIQRMLQARGIHQLFSHQAAAVDALLAGRHTVVATSTASGKSLCYNIPILEAFAKVGPAWGAWGTWGHGTLLGVGLGVVPAGSLCPAFCATVVCTVTFCM